MSKEEEILEEIKQTIFHYTRGCLSTGEEEAFKILEAALSKLSFYELYFRQIKFYYGKLEFTPYDIVKKFDAIEIIKKHKLLNYVLKNEKCANMYHLSQEEKDSLRKVLKDE